MAKHRLTKKELMIDEITHLREVYKERFGISVFELHMPCPYHMNLSLAQLLEIMRHIVDTGETIYEGYINYILKRPITLNDLNLNYAKN